MIYQCIRCKDFVDTKSLDYEFLCLPCHEEVQNKREIKRCDERRLNKQEWDNKNL